MVKVSLFDSAADLMAVPYLQARYGGSEPKRVGLKHPSIAPYGSFTCADDRELVISIQSEREWANFCRIVLGDESLPNDPRFCNNAVRTRHRDELEAIIQGIFSGLSHAQAVDRLTDAQAAYGAINSVQDLIVHPQLRTRAMTVNGQSVEVPATPYRMEWDEPEFRGAPQIGQHRVLPVAAELNATEV